VTAASRWYILLPFVPEPDSTMKAYLLTTGTLFALLALMHLWRTVEDWPRLSSDPSFVLGVAAIGVVAAAMSFWAFRLLRSPARS
jgi:drug/metabolite transporter (DMT)-like permease